MDRKVIIVVDDEPAVLGFLKELLLMHGYEVDAYLNAVDALDSFQNNPAQYQLLITDQTMPNMLGTELIQKTQEIQPIKAVLCSGISEKMDVANAKQAGISSFLIKPFDSEKLLAIVENSIAECK